MVATNPKFPAPPNPHRTAERRDPAVLPLPCPFCGKKVDLEDDDTLYPSGTYWRFEEALGSCTYHGRRDRLATDGECYVLNCTPSSGGCGAEMHGDSRELAIAAWNRRQTPGERQHSD